MSAMRLVRLIEAHSETLSKGLTDLIHKSNHAIIGYAEAAESVAKDDLKRARDLAISIGLMTAREKDCERVNAPIE